MGSDPGLVLGYGHQHLGHSMTDIVLDYKTQYEKRQEHSDSRINQVQEIVPGTVKPTGQATMNALTRVSSSTAAKPLLIPTTSDNRRSLFFSGKPLKKSLNSVSHFIISTNLHKSDDKKNRKRRIRSRHNSHCTFPKRQTHHHHWKNTGRYCHPAVSHLLLYQEPWYLHPLRHLPQAISRCRQDCQS